MAAEEEGLVAAAAQDRVGRALAPQSRTHQPKWCLSPQFETLSKLKRQHGPIFEIASSAMPGTIGKERQSSCTICLRQRV